MKKSTKRTTLAVAGVLGLGALGATLGTLSYFTDVADEENEFTVGNMDITLYESQLHRENSGRMGNFPALASDPDYCDWTASSSVETTAGNSTLINGSYEAARYCTPNMDVEVARAEGITAVANGHTAANRGWGYSDQTIIDDAATYKNEDNAATTDVDESGYFARASQNIVPGQWTRKFAYVVNEDESSDAYVLIRYMVPTEYADLIDIKVPGTPYEEDVHADIAGHQGYFTALTKDASGKYVAFDSSAKDSMDNYEGYTETIGGTEFKVYAAVTTDVVKPGEMTFWSPVNTIRLKTTATVDDFDYTQGNPIVKVNVDAQAVQAKTFANGLEAFNALQQ